TLGIRAEAERAERARALGRDQEVEECEGAARRLLELFDVADREEIDPQVERERLAGVAELSRLARDHDATPWLALAKQWREASQPYRAAYAEWRAAEAIVHSDGSSEDAQRLLASASDDASRLGARPLLDQI